MSHWNLAGICAVKVSQEITQDAPPLKEAGAPKVLGALAIITMLVGLDS